MPHGPPRIRTTSERIGAILIGFGVVQFVAAMGWAQAGYSGYSLLQNYISDLGNTATSPLHEVFNVSIMVLGVTAFVGILASWSAFPTGLSRPVGLLLLLVASVAAFLVGVFPENVNPSVHSLVSLLVFLPGGLALVVLSGGMQTPGEWSPLRFPSLGLGLITLASLAYFVPSQAHSSTWDPGLVERLIVAPILVWGALVSVHIARDRPARPRASPTTREPSP